MNAKLDALFEKIDCHSLPVKNLEKALSFYRKLGHKLVWRDEKAAGLKLPGTDAELVLHLDRRPAETDFKVKSVPEAVKRFARAGGRLVAGPFEIRIGLCAVVRDPWGNEIVMLDESKGRLRVGKSKRVIGR